MTVSVNELKQKTQKKPLGTTEQLRLHNVTIHRDDLLVISSYLKQNPNIHEVALQISEDIPPEDLHSLFDPNITILQIEKSNLTSDQVKALAKFGTLRSLVLLDCNLDDEKVKIFTENTSIKSLYLLENPEITAQSLKALAENQCIQSIALSGHKISDEGIEFLVASQSLTSLDIKLDNLTTRGKEVLLDAMLARTSLDVSLWGNQSPLAGVRFIIKPQTKDFIESAIFERLEYLGLRRDIFNSPRVSNDIRIKNKTNALLEHVEQLYLSEGNLCTPSTLIDVLRDTYNLLIGLKTSEEYQKSAQKFKVINDSAVNKWNVLAALMFGLGALCTAIAFAAAVTGVGVIPVSIAAAGGVVFFGAMLGCRSRANILSKQPEKQPLCTLMEDVAKGPDGISNTTSP